MKRPSFNELSHFLVTISDQFPHETLFKNGRANKPKQLANYLKRHVVSYGRAPACRIKLSDMDAKQRLESLLTKQKFEHDKKYGIADQDPTVEVLVAYFMWDSHGTP